jgi:hypothetical protein
MASRASVKNEKQYEALKDKGMSKSHAAPHRERTEAITACREAERVGRQPKQGGTHAQKQAAGRKGAGRRPRTSPRQMSCRPRAMRGRCVRVHSRSAPAYNASESFMTSLMPEPTDTDFFQRTEPASTRSSPAR